MMLDKLFKRTNGHIRQATMQQSAQHVELFLRENHPYLTIHLSYGQEDGWFVMVEEIEGAFAYADSFDEALWIISDSLAGIVEADLGGSPGIGFRSNR